jgi:hypothetical protein
MDAVLASVIAVLGTLLGSGVTHVFQLRAAERNEQSARDEKLRQERVEACSAYAGALLDYRRGQIHRWHLWHEERPAEEEAEHRARTWNQRSAAQQAMFRVQMITDDPAVTDLAEQALNYNGKLHLAEDLADLDIRRRESSRLISEFMRSATTLVR